ncbi:MAG: multifunctional CCA addition/repair protein [Gammaproteobacteria bacterium]|nr:multifunctional CCA addition/repair protein [Gammaproteobacteria bacterium]MBU1447517.1 multifunctional CCA addition/repair protein [Gammaproteobacteria bacterium]
MQVYCVGGAVRDRLLGLPVQDHDWVVVGSTPQEMEARGFKPVGADFPVFLHPETHEEYALARTERKTAAGYKGFNIYASPDVTLEQDLLRRDFTVNAIAEDEHGTLIDPHNGQADLKAGVLRHVSDAFAEDPVRILRGARFAARYGFSIAPETLDLMRAMAANGEVDALVAERVWQELARGLMERHPSRFFLTLRECGALKKILPEVDALFGVPQPVHYHPEVDCGVHVMMVLDDTAKLDRSLEVRFAALGHDLGKATTPEETLPRHIGHEQRSIDLVRAVCTRLRVPGDCRDLALLVAQFHSHVHRARDLRPDTIVKLFDRCDLWRKPERFERILEACISDAHGRTGHENDAYPQAPYLSACARAAQAVNAGEIARACPDKNLIADKVREARIVAVEEAIKNL